MKVYKLVVSYEVEVTAKDVEAAKSAAWTGVGCKVRWATGVVSVIDWTTIDVD